VQRIHHRCRRTHGLIRLGALVTLVGCGSEPGVRADPARAPPSASIDLEATPPAPSTAPPVSTLPVPKPPPPTDRDRPANPHPSVEAAESDAESVKPAEVEGEAVEIEPPPKPPPSDAETLELLERSEITQDEFADAFRDGVALPGAPRPSPP
jgi:hypothetical protein